MEVWRMDSRYCTKDLVRVTKITSGCMLQCSWEEKLLLHYYGHGTEWQCGITSW